MVVGLATLLRKKDIIHSELFRYVLDHLNTVVNKLHKKSASIREFEIPDDIRKIGIRKIGFSRIYTIGKTLVLKRATTDSLCLQFLILSSAHCLSSRDFPRCPLSL